MASKIGRIGCGVMGRWMLSNCMDARYPAFVCSRTASKCQPLIDKGAVVCSSPAEVATKSDVIFTTVGVSKNLEDVMFGNKGIFSNGLWSFKILVDMATSSPDLAKRIASKAEELCCSSLDAPVFGGEVGAKEGRLAIMVGGSSAAFTQVTPILKCTGNPDKGGRVELMGPLGSGQHAKLTNQIFIANVIHAFMEGGGYAINAGVDVCKALEMTLQEPVGSWILTHLAPRILENNSDPMVSVDYFLKDLEIALDECYRMDLDMQVLVRARKFLRILRAETEEDHNGRQDLFHCLEQFNGWTYLIR